MPPSPTPRCFWYQWVLFPFPPFDFVPFQTFFNSGIKAAEIRQQASQLLSDNLQIKIRKAFVWWLVGDRGGGAPGDLDTINFMFVSLGTLQFPDLWISRGLIPDYWWNRKVSWCSSDALPSLLNRIIITYYGNPSPVLICVFSDAHCEFMMHSRANAASFRIAFLGFFF